MGSCAGDAVNGTLSDDQTRDGSARGRWRSRICGCLKRESGAGRAGRFVVPAVQVDAATLGVRRDTGFVACQRERRARYCELTGNGKDRCEQAQAPNGGARYRARKLHVGFKVPFRDKKGSAGLSGLIVLSLGEGGT